MAVYNGEKYIYQQIESILAQLTSSDEIVVSDDGSSDKTLEIIRSFDDTRIVLIFNTSRRGLVKNIENALLHARGDHIFLADQDDVWVSNRVSTVIPFLRVYDLVISDCYVVDSTLNILKDSLFQINNSSPGFVKNLIKNSYVGCCMAFNKKILTSVLPFPNYIPMHDWWIGLVCDCRYKTFFINDKLVYYRRHFSNISDTASSSTSSFFLKIRWRMLLVIALFDRFVLSLIRKNHA
jgi:glycosyltransferase involved in cell wall biosynthesis